MFFPHQIVQETTIKPFVAIPLRLDSILTRLYVDRRSSHSHNSNCNARCNCSATVRWQWTQETYIYSHSASSLVLHNSAAK